MRRMAAGTQILSLRLAAALFVFMHRA